jgi:3',5'-cyclic AMP phosphodiesterase CpdA
MPQRFAQISDPHLSSLEDARPRDLLNKRALGYLSWRRKRRFEHRPEVLQALQQDLDVRDLDQLLITGDLTHIGLPSEFRQAASWLRQLGEPCQLALVPGNHDSCVRADWDQTYALWRDYMESDQPAGDRAGIFPSLRVRGKLAFIGLSTACPKPPLMATGSIDQDQLRRLPGILRDSGQRGLFRVLYLHHCPLPGVEKWRKRLTNADEVQAVIADGGAELVLHGHGHRAHRHELATVDGTAPVIAVPSASALGLHGADRASYNRYSVTAQERGWRLDIDTRRYDPRLGRFVDDGIENLDIMRPGRQPSPVNP